MKDWDNGTMVDQRPWKAAENPELIGTLLRLGSVLAGAKT